MAALQCALSASAQAVVDQFYRDLVRRPGARPLLESLSGSELAHLKAAQTQNLLSLAAPDLDMAGHRSMALRTGRVHAIIGLAEEDLLHSHDLFHAAVRDHVDVGRHEQALSVMARRLIKDLGYQQEAFKQLREMRNDVLLRITRLAWDVIGYSDLIGRVTEILGAHVEIAGCSLGRPDRDGIFEFESVAGEGMMAYLAASAARSAPFIMAGDVALARGPTGRAWQSGKVEHCTNYATDDRMIPWREMAEKVGFRSSVAIPLRPPGGETEAILTFYSRYPGGFGSTDQKAFIAQLATLLVFAITRLKQKEGVTHTIPYEVRRRWASLVRSDALEMHYQPIQRLDSGEILKAEALARLRDRDRLLTPGTFLPALSSDDLFELFARGLNQALEQQDAWRAEGLDIQVSVNLPTSALADDRYFAATRQAFLDKGADPRSITLEILETAEVPNGVDVRGALMRFKELGIGLAEDDLGSGHSSLSRLREMPFDVIKIDRSIVARTDEDVSKVLHFIKQLTRLGHSLGQFVIVEGVEEPDMVEAVAILGADAVQGYAVARPMAAAAFAEWMRRRTPARPANPILPKSRVAKFARILMWEEYLIRLVEEVPMGNRLAAIAMSNPLFDSIAESMQRALIDAALRHGPRSEQYRLAHRELVDSLAAE